MALSEFEIQSYRELNNIPDNYIFVPTVSGGGVYVNSSYTTLIQQYESGQLTGASTEPAPGGVWLRVLGPDPYQPTTIDNPALQEGPPSDAIPFDSTQAFPSTNSNLNIFVPPPFDPVVSNPVTPVPPSIPTTPPPVVIQPNTGAPTFVPAAVKTVNPIDLSMAVQVSTRVINREYVKNSMAAIQSEEFEIRNITTNIDLSIGIRSLGGVVFSPSNFTLKAGEVKRVVASFDLIEVNAYPEGLNAVTAVLDITSDTVILQPTVPAISTPPITPAPLNPSIINPPQTNTTVIIPDNTVRPTWISGVNIESYRQGVEYSGSPPIGWIISNGRWFPPAVNEVENENRTGDPVPPAWVSGVSAEGYNRDQVYFGTPPSNWFQRDRKWYPPVYEWSWVAGESVGGYQAGQTYTGNVPAGWESRFDGRWYPARVAEPQSIWVSGVTVGGFNEGGIYYGSPPAGWVKDPYGGDWYPANDPYVLSGWGRNTTMSTSDVAVEIDLKTPVLKTNNTAWVNGVTGEYTYGSPPAGWVKDPYGGSWFPANDPYVLSGWGRSTNSDALGTTTVSENTNTTTTTVSSGGGTASTGTPWVSGRSGDLNYGSPPDGWVQDPYGGAWYSPTDPYVLSGWGQNSTFVVDSTPLDSSTVNTSTTSGGITGGSTFGGSADTVQTFTPINEDNPLWGGGYWVNDNLI